MGLEYRALPVRQLILLPAFAKEVLPIGEAQSNAPDRKATRSIAVLVSSFSDLGSVVLLSILLQGALFALIRPQMAEG